jgi:UDP-sulfoquinovose synthase
VQAWKEVSGKSIAFHNIDVALEYDLLVQLLQKEQPDAVVHFAEQRAAPYSMKNSKTKRYTINNNVCGSNNLCCAVLDVPGLAETCHIVHLGTMGVYGYGTSGGEIPEGYLDVILPGGREQTILHPAYPGSIYHATKCLDALLWQFYQKNDALRVTDLHQGIVWGTNTPQTCLDERLINRFDYDGDYGTVLNRFLMQAAMNVPLTVYGTGGQTRAFIHISDTARCIDIAIRNPPNAGERVEIFNQVAETRRVRDIAQMVADMTGVAVNFIPNPRQEAAENDLDVANAKFCNLGLTPITLQAGLFDEVTEIVKKYQSRCNPTKILPASFWNKKRAEECAAGGMSDDTPNSNSNAMTEVEEQAAEAAAP